MSLARTLEAVERANEEKRGHITFLWKEGNKVYFCKKSENARNWGMVATSGKEQKKMYQDGDGSLSCGLCQSSEYCPGSPSGISLLLHFRGKWPYS